MLCWFIPRKQEDDMKRTPRGIWRRFKHWQRTTHWLTARKVAIVLAGLLVIVTVLGSVAEYGFFNLQRLFLDMWANWSAELASIVITVWVIDSLNRRRAIADEKEDLILQMGSPDNAFALEAVRKLRARGWGFGEDKSLHHKSFANANLHGAKLEDINLQHTWLFASIMDNTLLIGANLHSANLQRAKLSGANLARTNLQEAVVIEADLQNAYFEKTDLRGANLQDANLKGCVSLNQAQLDTRTILPDGSHWSPDVDTTRFTDTDHAQFWRSTNPISPAYPNP
jgi:hypothetical protein